MTRGGLGDSQDQKVPAEPGSLKTCDAPGVRGKRAEARLFQHAVSIAGGGGKELRRCDAQGGEMGGGVMLKRRVGV